MRQSETFLSTEGDAWFARNRAKMGERDPVSDAITYLKLKPESVLEIGCANGWRLAALRERYGCTVYGIEPSQAAAQDAARLKVPVWQATAAAMPAHSAAFDLVIYGFCLYLTDPEDWFRIAMEGDRVLKDGGHLIIYDFDNAGGRAYARRYKHNEDILSYHVDFEKFWLAHPWYRRIYCGPKPSVREHIIALQKQVKIPVLS